MYSFQLPDNYDTYAGPTPTIYETDITLNLCVKVEKIKGLHQVLENDKGGWFYVQLSKLSKKLHKNKLQKMCRFVLHYFHARPRPRYFRDLPSFSVFLSYGLENFERKVRHLRLPSFRRFRREGTRLSVQNYPIRTIETRWNLAQTFEISWSSYSLKIMQNKLTNFL